MEANRKELIKLAKKLKDKEFIEHIKNVPIQYLNYEYWKRELSELILTN